MRCLLLGVALVAAAFDCHAARRLARVEVLNRDTGQVLPVYQARGETWVAGSPGARYAVLIQNRCAERLLAVTSVDGINVITGENAAAGGSGYVFAAGARYAIEGWRKSHAQIAAFDFTSLPDSYAVRTGRQANAGVIGVALFRERPAAQPQPAPPAVDADEARLLHGQNRAASPGAARQARRAEGAASAPDGGPGTGHVAREYSYVSDTVFKRRASRPDETIRIRYDRYENLVAMGVISAPPVPNPFSGDGAERFVPDPSGS